jgi:hypothetical protein
MPRNLSSKSSWFGLAAVAVFALVGACSKGDVGAPCNHGRIEPPESKLVTFPALTCDELLCVYADEEEAPADACNPGVEGNSRCNEADPTRNRFECVPTSDGSSGICRLRIDYVLERSMCSKRCGDNDDCKNGGITQQVVVDDTECATGFECARIQSLGEFCCEKLCVCRDDLGVSDLDMKCAAGTQEGCCDQDPVPAACGRP